MALFPKLKVTYFNTSGRAESIRLAFHVGGIPFEDERLTREEFIARKPTFPFGQVPALEIDGQVFAQSQAMLRYAGRLANLYPANDPLAALKVDEVLSALDEFWEKMMPSFLEKDLDKKKAMREELARDVLPRYLKNFEARLAAMSKNVVFQSDSLFIHEIGIYSLVQGLKSGFMDYIPTTIVDAYPGVLAVEAKVAGNQKVKEWYAATHAAPKLKLTYFNGPGRAEPIRLSFHLGGLEFEDEFLVDRADLERRRSKLPYGQVPVLEVNGEILAQSYPILIYAGTLAGLYPANDPIGAYRVDELLCILDEHYNNVSPTYRMPAEEQLAARRVLAETRIPRALGWIEARITKWGGPYATGAQLTIADLAIYSLVLGLKNGATVGFDTTLADSCTQVIRIYNQVRDHPKIKEYYAKKK